MIFKNIWVNFALLAGNYCLGSTGTVNLQETMQSTTSNLISLVPFQVGQISLNTEPLKKYDTFSRLACTLLCVQYHHLDCVAFNYSENSQICQLYGLGLNSVSFIEFVNNSEQKYYYTLNILNAFANAYLSSSSATSTELLTTISTSSTTLISPTSQLTTKTTFGSTSSPRLSCNPSQTFPGQNYTFTSTSYGINVTCACYSGIENNQGTIQTANTAITCLAACRNHGSSCKIFVFSEASNTCYTEHGNNRVNATPGQSITCFV